jgi:N utilization substance protein A
MVIVDEDQHSLLVVVPDDQLSLAIGRQGQNVRLASRLLSWRIDVKSEQRYENLGNAGYKSLLEVGGVNEPLADKFLGAGIYSSVKLAEADLDKIMEVSGVDEDRAAEMKLQAADVPAPESEADALFAAPEEEQPGNVVKDQDVQPDAAEGAPEVEASTEKAEDAPGELDGNTIVDPEPEQQPEDEVVDGNTIREEPGNS